MPSFSKECLGGFVGFQGLACPPNPMSMFLQAFSAPRRVKRPPHGSNPWGSFKRHENMVARVSFFRKTNRGRTHRTSTGYIRQVTESFMTQGRSSLASARETARSALNAAFGSVEVGAVTPIPGGASGAFPFRVEIGGRSYLVRVEGPASPLRNPRQYDSMRIAAQAGIAPKLHHIDEAARVAVMDFIEERS
jgi:hypothetical protein